MISPPAAPVITSAADALAVVLNERGRVDLDHIAELLHRECDEVIAELGDAIFHDPADGSWQTADAYLSGAVRDKLEGGGSAPPRSILALRAQRHVRCRRVSPLISGPSDITARLGAPWIPAADVVAFVKETMEAEIQHPPHAGTRAPGRSEARQLGWMAAGTSEWGTDRRHAGQLSPMRSNSRVPQIFDTINDGDGERRVLNVVDTEAAKEKLQQDQDRVPALDLVRSRSDRPPGAGL